MQGDRGRHRPRRRDLLCRRRDHRASRGRERHSALAGGAVRGARPQRRADQRLSPVALRSGGRDRAGDRDLASSRRPWIEKIAAVGNGAPTRLAPNDDPRQLILAIALLSALLQLYYELPAMRAAIGYENRILR